MAGESLKLARQTEDPLLVAMAHWYLGVALFSRGEHAPARAHLKEVIDFYRPEEHHQAFVLLRGSDAGLGALAYDACCLWCLGYPDQAKRRGDEALGLARELGHPFSTADVVCFAGCTLSGMRRDALALKERAQELMRLATEKTAVWLASAQCYLGGALVVEGRADAALVQMRDVMPAIQERGAICHMSETLSFSAQAQALAERPDEALATLAEALVFVEESEQRHLEPELHRLTAEMHLMMGDEAGAESSLHKAIEVARRQQARSWELRAAMDLARLWRARGKVEQARRMLSAIYAWFTEGFDTRDLREAKALLEGLA
jgi:adenylate cyclase